ncbi:heavy-metal-associated domain-containing protein [Pedobacter psychroterrae]|nr:cation transporter [Pedobacter psychroterrae]
MKTIKIFSIATLLFIAGTVSAQQISSAELQVTGLTCSMCSQATEKSLKTLDFIESIKPDLNKNTFMIEFKDQKPVNMDLIKKKVQDAGFSIGNLVAVINFNNTNVNEDGLAVAGPNAYKFLNAKSKVLNGNVKVSVVDKNFISGPAFKKKAAQVAADSYTSGYELINGKRTRVYHVSI